VLTVAVVSALNEAKALAYGVNAMFDLVWSLSGLAVTVALLIGVIVLGLRSHP
jgi:hypothetical protein